MYVNDYERYTKLYKLKCIILKEKRPRVNHFPLLITSKGFWGDFLRALLIYVITVYVKYNCRAEMLKHLREGTSLIVDRYAYSGVCYTAAKQVGPHCVYTNAFKDDCQESYSN